MKTITQSIIGILFLLSMSSLNLADHGTPTSSCGIISSSGYYSLSQNIGTGGSCFNITASDVTIDCHNRKIAYGAAYGIQIQAPQFTENYTIKNCFFNKNGSLSGLSDSAFQAYGVYGNITIWNNTFNLSTSSPIISIGNGVNNSNISLNKFFQNGTFETNGSAIDMSDVYNSYIEDNQFNITAGNAIGITINGGNISILRNNINTTSQKSTGISITLLLRGAVISENKIITYGEGGMGGSAPAISIAEANGIIVRHNSFKSINNNGVEIQFMNDSIWENNTIRTDATFAGFTAALSMENIVHNNLFINNNITAPNNVFEIKDDNTNYYNYLIYNNSFGELTWQNNGSSNSLVRNMTISVNGSLALGETIFIQNGSISLNISSFENAPAINRSINMTFFGLGLPNVAAIYQLFDFSTVINTIVTNGVQCNLFSINLCYDIEYNSVVSILRMNASSTGSFAPQADTTAPRFNSSLANITVDVNESLEKGFNATDDFSLVFYFVNDTSQFSINNTGVLKNASRLVIQSYDLSITINDSYNNKNTTSFKVTVSDLKPPRFDPFPTNQSVQSNIAFSYDFNATDMVSLVTFGVNDTNFNINSTGGLTNASALQIRTYILNITINDTSNNKNNTYFQVIVLDTQAPTFNPFPINQTVEANTSFTYDFNASDSSTVTYHVNDSTFSINSTGGLINASALKFQSYLLNITINDTSNNKNFTYFNVTVIDTIMPRFDPFPTNQTIESNTTFLYDFDAIDLVSLVTFGVNDTNFNINSTGALLNTSPLQLRNYTLNITINDTFNNKNNTYFRLIVQDTTAPSFLFPVINQSERVGDSFAINLSGYDLNGVNFSINGTMLEISGNVLRNVAVLEEGFYLFNISINDSSNNRNFTFFSLTVIPQLQVSGGYLGLTPWGYVEQINVSVENNTITEKQKEKNAEEIISTATFQEKHLPQFQNYLFVGVIIATIGVIVWGIAQLASARGKS